MTTTQRIIRTALNRVGYKGTDPTEAINALRKPITMQPVRLVVFQQIAVGMGVPVDRALTALHSHPDWVQRLERALAAGDVVAVQGSVKFAPPVLQSYMSALENAVTEVTSDGLEAEARDYEVGGEDVDWTAIAAVDADAVAEAMGW